MKAAVFVDVQNDFLRIDDIKECTGVHRSSALPFGYPEKDNVMDIVKFAEKCAADPEWKLYATRDTHVADHVDLYDVHKFYEDHITPADIPYSMTLEGKKLPVPHCIEGYAGWLVYEPLMKVLDGHCTFANKPTFGSFDLCNIIAEDIENNHCKIDEIVLCGYCTSICVLANAVLLRAKFPNMKITVMKDLCGCMSEESHRAALKVLEMQQIDVI